MTRLRALRVLFVANDGFSAGHVARTLAIARAFARRAAARDIEPRMLLATTSEAHALLDGEPALAIVRLPAPVVARRAGFSDLERRRLVHGALEGVADAFAPDLIVADTFPSGPHGELASIWVGRCKRALVRRATSTSVATTTTTTATPTATPGVLTDGLLDYDIAILADDPIAYETTLPESIPVVRVPPITMGEARDGWSREDARKHLGLPSEGRVVLIAAGGGGDAESAARANSIAATIARIAPDITVALALGPLAPAGMPTLPAPAGMPTPAGPAGMPTPAIALAAPADMPTPAIALAAPAGMPTPAIALAAPAGMPTPLGPDGMPTLIRVAPLQPLLAAFDGAIAPAGYNTAHELAKARVPTALFAQPRPYDDQAGRAARFAAASLAHVLDGVDDDAIGRALAWMFDAARQDDGAAIKIEAGGADRAADALLDLVTGKRPTNLDGR